MPSRYKTIDDAPLATGEGITSTNHPSARYWPVYISFTTGGQPMRCTILAVSAAQAKKFAHNRHPMAKVVRVDAE